MSKEGQQQRRFWNYKDNDSTKDLNLKESGIIDSGLYRGFDFVPTANLILRLSQEDTGAVFTKQDGSVSAKHGVLKTKQGVVTHQEGDIELPVANGIIRADLVIATHEYTEVAGGSTLIYSIIQGTEGNLNVPTLTNPSKQTPLGVLLLEGGGSPVNQLDSPSVSYEKSVIPTLASKQTWSSFKGKRLNIDGGTAIDFRRDNTAILINTATLTHVVVDEKLKIGAIFTVECTTVGGVVFLHDNNTFVGPSSKIGAKKLFFDLTGYTGGYTINGNVDENMHVVQGTIVMLQYVEGEKLKVLSVSGDKNDINSYRLQGLSNLTEVEQIKVSKIGNRVELKGVVSLPISGVRTITLPLEYNPINVKVFVKGIRLALPEIWNIDILNTGIIEIVPLTFNVSDTSTRKLCLDGIVWYL